MRYHPNEPRRRRSHSARLYYYRENIDEDVQVSSEQLLWLAMHPLRDADVWHKDGKLQSLDASEFPEEIRAKLITAKLELPLRYLQYRRLITYARRSDGMLYAAVTFAGADRAIRLHTRGAAWTCGTASTETALSASPSPS